MNTQHLLRLCIPDGNAVGLAHNFIRDFIAQGGEGTQLEKELSSIVADPTAFFVDPLRVPLARMLYHPPFTPAPNLPRGSMG